MDFLNLLCFRTPVDIYRRSLLEELRRSVFGVLCHAMHEKKKPDSLVPFDFYSFTFLLPSFLPLKHT